jgi:hypothetical protein
VVGAEVVENEVQPRLDGMQRADIPAELQELDAGLALLDVPVEPVGADVVGLSSTAVAGRSSTQTDKHL